MKETEKEVIEIDIQGEMNYFLIKDLESCIALYYAGKVVGLDEHWKLLESVLKKCKQKKPRYFSARECATIIGFLEQSFQLTKKSKFEILTIIFKKSLEEWEKNNPDIN